MNLDMLFSQEVPLPRPRPPEGVPLPRARPPEGVPLPQPRPFEADVDAIIEQLRKRPPIDPNLPPEDGNRLDGVNPQGPFNDAPTMGQQYRDQAAQTQNRINEIYGTIPPIPPGLIGGEDAVGRMYNPLDIQDMGQNKDLINLLQRRA
jgi:hypothetical protein